ncbi:hypothetical protein Tco_0410981 [Tanacetum coccineum]
MAGPQKLFTMKGTQDNIDAVKRSTTKDAGDAPNKHPDLKIDEKPIDKKDQVFLDELERLKRQEKDANDAAEALKKEFAQETENLLLQAGAAKASSANIINVVSTPVSTASPYDGLSFSDPTNPDQDDSEIPALEKFIKILLIGGYFTNSFMMMRVQWTDHKLETCVNVSPIPHQGLNSIHSFQSLILGESTISSSTSWGSISSESSFWFNKLPKPGLSLYLFYLVEGMDSVEETMSRESFHKKDITDDFRNCGVSKGENPNGFGILSVIDWKDTLDSYYAREIKTVKLPQEDVNFHSHPGRRTNLLAMQGRPIVAFYTEA